MSDEVEIVCLGDTAVLRDLGLTMNRGSRMTVTFSAASKSVDLEIAKRQGLVGVRAAKPTVVRTDPMIAMTKRTDGDHNLKIIQRAAIPMGNAAPPVMDTTSLEAAMRDLTREVAELREDLRRVAVPAAASVDAGAIAEAIRSALAGIVIPVASGGVTPASSVRLEAPDEERFIPSGIVPTNLKADISPNTTNEGSGSLEDAQAALREARRRVRENQ